MNVKADFPGFLHRANVGGGGLEHVAEGGFSEKDMPRQMHPIGRCRIWKVAAATARNSGLGKAYLGAASWAA
jgi:hypothetical protein